MTSVNNKVVYTALTRMTNDRDVIKQAFIQWHGKFAHKDLDVFATVEFIESFLGLDTGEKKVLMVSMHSAASKDESQLKDVPEYIFGSGGDNATEPDVSALYFSHISQSLQRSGTKYVTELMDVIRDEGLPNVSMAVRDALSSMVDGELDLPGNTSEDACKMFCHEVYMLVCDIVGPMEADEISYSAIAKLLETNEASRYDPRNLI